MLEAKPEASRPRSWQVEEDRRGVRPELHGVQQCWTQCSDGDGPSGARERAKRAVNPPFPTGVEMLEAKPEASRLLS